MLGMRGYETSTYGDRMAEFYDDQYPEPTGEPELLAELAGEGPVLELGIGTGRVALPLVERGIEVHGVDASEAMVAKLREKPGGDAIQVTIGDMADVVSEGEFSLIYVVFNTFYAILTQEHQLRCFQNVAARLKPGGRFLITAFVPDMKRFERRQRLETMSVAAHSATIHVARYDPVTQTIDSANLHFGAEGVGIMPIAMRFAYPPELDLMARIAGLSLEDRWGDWNKEQFGPDSDRHISVWKKAA